MAEYIEREHLKDKFNRYLNAPHVRGGYSIGQGMRVAIKSCIAMLDEEPTAEVEPVRRGRWIPEENSDVYFSCSYCGCEICTSWDYDDLEWNFCPECGCAMDGGADNG